MSINRGMDKDNVGHIHNGILFSHKKEHNWVTCRDVDRPLSLPLSRRRQQIEDCEDVQVMCQRSAGDPGGEGGRSESKWGRVAWVRPIWREESTQQRWACGRREQWDGNVLGGRQPPVGLQLGGMRKTWLRLGSRPCPQPVNKLSGPGSPAAETRRGPGQVAIPWTQGVMEHAACGGWSGYRGDERWTQQERNRKWNRKWQIHAKRNSKSLSSRNWCVLSEVLTWLLTYSALIRSLTQSFLSTFSSRSLVYWRNPSSLKAMLYSFRRNFFFFKALLKALAIVTIDFLPAIPPVLF